MGEGCDCRSGTQAARKYYKLTRAGKVALEASRKRYPLISKLTPIEEVEQA